MNTKYNYKMSKADFALLIKCGLRIPDELADNEISVNVNSIAINELDEVEVEYIITN